MKTTTLDYLLFILLCAFNMSVNSQKNELLTEAQAKEEAQIAIGHIKKSHPDPYWANSKDIWDSYEKKLLSRKGDISIARHYFDLAYLFSLADDTHTQIYPDHESGGFESVYPLRFRTFADGLYIISANEDYEEYIGKKVVSFGDKTASELINILSEYASSDNVERKRSFTEMMLVMPETYSVFGVANNNRVKLVLEDIQGNRSRGILKKTEQKSFATIFWDDPNSFGILVPDNWKTVYDVFKAKVPITRQHLRKKYWHATLKSDNGKVVEYIQINKNENEGQGGKLSSTSFSENFRSSGRKGIK